jgi:hypothetical protein
MNYPQPEYKIIKGSQLLKSVAFEINGIPIQKCFTDPLDLLSDIIENHFSDIEYQIIRFTIENKSYKNFHIIESLRNKYENRSDVIDIINKYF